MLTTFLADDMLAAYFDGGVPGDPATAFVSLYEAVTAGAAGTGTEASYTGYARQSLGLGALAADMGGRAGANDGLITFPQTNAIFTQIAFGIHDAVSAGNVMAFVYLDDDADEPILATVNAAGLATDQFDAPGHPFTDDDRVRLAAGLGSAIPTGVVEDTTYWVVASAADVFDLSLTQSGPSVNITVVGGVQVFPLTPKVYAINDSPEIAIGQLTVGLGTL